LPVKAACLQSQELNIPLKADNGEIQAIVQEVKRLEDLGYQYDAAEGSFELLIRNNRRFVEPFSLKTLRVLVEKNKDGHPPVRLLLKFQWAAWKK